MQVNYGTWYEIDGLSLVYVGRNDWMAFKCMHQVRNTSVFCWQKEEIAVQDVLAKQRD